ncbi:DUF523 domain-containing protein [Thalassotalea sp. PP2-459]|uniref:DUF523 domain-containing protein n=1 Tax=Thalassotalea sp. PP2-459 TaxID=1742724 RepID=UPI0009431413|nr:DUF523 domain-containing protein [Thalassotalea sp. PP2-459]OKY27041.1 hypothetical protein BI291_10435 [Thalassotalea sp. PP2-459]
MEKILVSACLMGDLVRYDGGHQQLVNKTFEQWQHEGRLVKVCPEVVGGLSTPRAPAERVLKDNLVIDVSGKDVTHAFTRGANIALSICLEQQIKYALLKDSSPSCGSNTIYDGRFTGSKISGVGLTTELLRQHDIEVYSENTVLLLAEKLTHNEKKFS